MTTSILTLDGQPLKDYSDPDRKVMWSKRDVWGDPVIGSLRTIAHLDKTSKQAEKRFGFEIEALQGAYNDDIEASAGTHDKDAVLDVFIPNVPWKIAQTFLRARGWAAWWRYPPTFGNHIHMISLGFRLPVGEFVPGQVADYRATPPRDGLAGHAVDPTWHPDDIDSTIFDFQEWEREMEDNMPLSAEDKKWMREMTAGAVTRIVGEYVDDIAKAVMLSIVDVEDNVTAREALRKTLDRVERIKEEVLTTDGGGGE